jgi:CheY-like chemotaxis protein
MVVHLRSNETNKVTVMNTDARGNGEWVRKVLLVDDEKMVLEVGVAILQRLGHAVIPAQSGEEALEQYAGNQESIGCVVLDLSMPGMDGRETFEKLRALNPELPIIIASGMTVDQVMGQFDDMPPTSIIQKPYQIADLSTKIQDTLNEV